MSAVGLLVGVTNGWTEDTPGSPGSVTMYVEEFMMLSDYDALTRAIRRLLRTWDSTMRPPLVQVLNAYQVELRTRDEQRALPPATVGHKTVTEAAPIIRAAYEEEARKNGREPDYEFLERFLGAGREDRRRGQEARRRRRVLEE